MIRRLVLNHCMLRLRDPGVSLDFLQRASAAGAPEEPRALKAA